MTFAERLLPALLCAAGLAGCGTIDKVERIVKEDSDKVEELRRQQGEGAASTAVLVRPNAKLAGEEIALKPQENLPAIFQRQTTYTTAGQQLDEVLEVVSRQIGVPIWVTEFASDTGSSAYNSRSDQGHGRAKVQLQWNGTVRGLLDHLAQTAKLHWRFNEGRVEFYLYETRHFYVNLPMGSRTMTSRISGSGRNGSIDGSSYGNGNNAYGNAGYGSRNAGTGDISISTGDMQINPYNALTRTITAMLMEDDGRAEIVGSADSGYNGSGNANMRVSANDVVRNSGGSGGSITSQNRRPGRSRVVVTPEMAMVTVTAPPTSLDRIADYIARVNQRFSKNVMIDVKIYDVSLNDQASVGFSADILYKKLGSYGVQMAGGTVGLMGTTQADLASLAAASVAAAGTTVTTTTVDPITGLPVTTTSVTPGVTQKPPSRFAGSALIAQALQSFGNISSITSGQVMAVNGQPAPLQIATEVTYLASTQVTNSANALQTNAGTAVTPVATALTPGSVVVGLTANFLPQVLGDNRILLQYQLTSSSLAGMSTVTSGGSSIQTPTVASQSLQQQAFVRDGEAIVLFGLEQNTSSLTGGQSVPANVGRDASKARSMRVIVMQVFGGGKNANI